MQFVKNTFKWIPNVDSTKDPIPVYKRVENIARTCYKSYEKISENSSENFITMLRNRKHWAMLEHHVFHLSVPEHIFGELQDMKASSSFPEVQDKMKYISLSSYRGNGERVYIVTGSVTSFNYLWEVARITNGWYDGSSNFVPNAAWQICNYLDKMFPLLMKRPPLEITEDEESIIITNTETDHVSIIEKVSLTNEPIPKFEFGYFHENIKLMSDDELLEVPVEHRRFHETITIKFDMDIGLGREILRHRPTSPAQESTRYCNYGNIGIKITDHMWKENASEECQKMFDSTLDKIEECYNFLIAHGVVPEFARDILPLTTSSELVITAPASEWSHIFNMRCGKGAHPEMKALMKPVLKDMIERYPHYFKHQGHYLEEDLWQK